MSCANPIPHGSTSGGSEVIQQEKKKKRQRERKREGENGGREKKKIARIPQGFAVIPDGEIVGLPTVSPVGTGASMITNLRRLLVVWSVPRSAAKLRVCNQSLARALYAKRRYAERQMATGQACAAVCVEGELRRDRWLVAAGSQSVIQSRCSVA